MIKLPAWSDALVASSATTIGRVATTAMVAVAALTGCGGEEAQTAVASAQRTTMWAQAATTNADASSTDDIPAKYTEAARFLGHATFGPTTDDVAELRATGYAAWLDGQVRLAPLKVRSYVEANLASKGSIGTGDVIDGIWNGMLTDKAQLRQRVAFALSEIFVISLVDGGVHSNPRSAAAYYDMLLDKGLGNYRDLLQSVAMHPMMGQYLSHRGNQKADPATGRVADENFAREIMQLFSIGLVELNVDGTPRLGGDGKTIETYGPADIAGLAKVFTGWSWFCPAGPTDGCFSGSSPKYTGDPDSDIKPMMAYPKYHSTEEKRFLGVTIPAQGTPDPAASLRVALDTLFKHPNTAPFMARELIRRLTSSNPSRQYVSDVAAKFIDNGAGVRGDLAAVVRSILLHPEARNPGASAGKVREPVLRLSAFVRAFPFTSLSGRYTIGSTDSEAIQLAQTPLLAGSVFNFFRPAFVPPGSATQAEGMVAPEMQLVNDTSIAGFVTYMRWIIERGDVGITDPSGKRDVQIDVSKMMAKADDSTALVRRVNKLLLYGGMSPTFQTELTGIVGRMAIPVLAADKSNQAAVDAAKRKRVNAALLLTIASPEFIVQK